MAFNGAGTGRTVGVPDFTKLEIKHTHLRLLGESSNDTVARSEAARRVVAGPSRIQRAGETPEYWWDRRFAATRVIGDDDFVDTLLPVKESLRREQFYRRALGLADGGSALAISVVTALLWGASFQWLFALVPAIAVLVAKVQGLYDHDEMVVRKSTLSEWRLVLRATALTTMGSYMIWWLSTQPPEGRGIRVFAVLMAGMFFLELPSRALARRVARALTTDDRCLIVGSPERCVELAESLSVVEGVHLIGIVSDDDVDCSVAGVHELVEQLNVQRIVVVPHAGWGERGPLKLIQSSKWLGVRISLMPTVMTVVGAYTTVDELDSMVLLGVPRFGLSRSSQALKRAFDLVGVAAMLVVLSPLFAAIAIAIRLDSPGPVLFRQKRIGRGGAPFTMYKFRSMVDNAEGMKQHLAGHNETSGLFKMTDDPRITRAGKLLRRTYLDELPQLLNVLRGNMSLVGPRPLVESEDVLLTGFDRHRTRITPGMTGPWQLRGPINASLPELAKLDYMYASNWSIWTDIDIMLGTAARVLSRRGH